MERLKPSRPAAGGHDENARRAAQVLTVYRLCRRTDGVQALLQWLAHRTGYWTGLVDLATGAVLRGAPRRYGTGAEPLLGEELRATRERGLRSFVLDDDPARSGAAVGGPSTWRVGGLGPGGRRAGPLLTFSPGDAVPMLGVG
ncbi:hypothetical protein [Streptomyces sp. NPDC088725]|uniref:hypothetical protein n=1 Tax=Streptomyces sp. NPDC088725 TaxID=3365873 RepID=UPI0038266793